jgi:hypothetical protein
VNSQVEPLNAKQAVYRAYYANGANTHITLAIVPVEAGRFKLWALVFVQEGRRMTLTGKEPPEAALTWGAQSSKEFTGSTIRAFAAGFCEPTIQPPPQKARVPTPLNSDDEDGFMTEDQKRAQASARKRAQKRGLPAPSRLERAGEPTQSSTQMITRSKAKALTDETSGKVPEECVAGGRRVVARSGQKGMRAANRRSPKT